MALIAYQCPNCGGEIRFDPASQKYKCEYCFSLFSQEELDAIQEKQQGGQNAESAGDAEPDAAAGGEAMVYSCPNCGAQIVTTETTAASVCYYCHTPVVLQGRLKGDFRPDRIIPFQIDRKKALEIFEGWIQNKKYVPDDFYSKSQIDTMTGVYFPYWLYGCRAEGTVQAQGTKLKIWTAGTMRYTKTEQYQVNRGGNMEIRNLMRGALSTANQQLAAGVLPYDMAKLQDFNMDYLAGFMAENRDIGKEQFEQQVKDEVKEYVCSSIRNNISGFSSVQVTGQEVRLRDESWQYALLPVWTLTYKAPVSEKIYYFACNGVTGKVCGVLPVDNGKLRRLFIKIFAVLFAVLLIVLYLFV